MLATGQESAARAYAGNIECRHARADFLGERGPQYLQGGGDIGQQGDILAVEFGVQDTIGERFDTLGWQFGQSGEVGLGSDRCNRNERGDDAVQRGVPGGIAWPGLRRERRHAVRACQCQCRGIGQRQGRQGLQRVLLRA